MAHSVKGNRVDKNHQQKAKWRRKAENERMLIKIEKKRKKYLKEEEEREREHQ